MGKFTNLHLKSHFSNATRVPSIISKPEDYLEKAIENNEEAFCFTEEGSVLSWVSKKNIFNSYNMKYIHGAEVYVTKTLEEKIRDNYRIVLIAKNEQGVYEINSLVSDSYLGRGGEEDNHYHYVPRVSFDELNRVSENVLILTGGLASPLWQNYARNTIGELNEWLDLFVGKSKQVWFEVQPHTHGEQRRFNQLLVNWSKEFDIPLVATNDVQAINEEHEKLGRLLAKSSRGYFEAEDRDSFDLTYKTYDEMLLAFKEQDVLSDEQIVGALQETQNIVDLVEDFEFNHDFKYPQIFDNPKQRFMELIKEGLVNRGYYELPKEEQSKWNERLKHEVKVFDEMSSINYILLMEYVISSGRAEGKHPGYGRGSSSGSLVAYLLGIVDVNPIKEGLSFERFMNKDRVTLSDIDTDYESKDRDWIANFILTNDLFDASYIVTYNRLGLKGAIRSIGRALDYEPSEMDDLSSSIQSIDGEDVFPTSMIEQYGDVIDYAKKVIGTVTSIGRHAGGFIVTTDKIKEKLGTVRVSQTHHPVSAVAMREVEGLFYVKLDILGLDNIGLINKTAELAGIERPTPDSDFVDFNDEDVIEDIASDTTAIFQFEEERAEKLISTMFQPEVQERIAQSGVNTDYVNQMALLSAAMRPGAISVVDDIVNGKTMDNGHDALNELLEDTLGYLIYQESQIQFLVSFCGRTPSEADLVRRAIGHKEPETLAVEIPKIRDEFIETMVSKHGDTKEHAESIIDSFLQIFQDASDYSFSKNHAIPYSYLGYISGWLRYYYPLEFCTAALQIWNDTQSHDKIERIINYAKKRGIKVEPARFRKSKGEYFFDKETNTIYEGTAPIKGNNAKVGDLLYEEFGKREFENFSDFLLQLKDDKRVIMENGEGFRLYEIFTSQESHSIKVLDTKIRDKTVILQTVKKHAINKTQLESLILLDYFQEFDHSGKLIQISRKFNECYNPNNKTLANKAKRFNEVLEFEKSLKADPPTIVEKYSYQMYYLGRVTIVDERIPKNFNIIIEMYNRTKTKVNATIYNINTGNHHTVRIPISMLTTLNLKEGDLVDIRRTSKKPRWAKRGDEWYQSDIMDLWIDEMKLLQRAKEV